MQLIYVANRTIKELSVALTVVPLESRVDVVSRSPPYRRYVPRVVQLHLAGFIVAPPVHGAAEYVRFAVVAPDDGRVHAVQLLGQSERRQRLRVSSQRVVAVEQVILTTCAATFLFYF